MTIPMDIAALALVGGGYSGAATPTLATVGGGKSIQYVCEYEQGNHCVGWYPNENTCRNILQHGTDAQVATCMAWSGWGSRG